MHYLRLLAASVALGGDHPFQTTAPVDLKRAGFLEIEPKHDRFMSGRYPFVVVYHLPTQHQRDGHRRRRIANGKEPDGRRQGAATQRHLRRQFKSRYAYRMDFWIQNPEDDILSDPRPMESHELSSPVELDRRPGIVDQCLQFIAEHPWFTDGENPIRVLPGASGIVTDPMRELSAYKIFLEVSFEDGLWTLETRSTLDGAILKINPEVKHESA